MPTCAPAPATTGPRLESGGSVSLGSVFAWLLGWNLGGDRTEVDGGPNQFPEEVSADRLVLTAGKFGVGDVFDANRYAHDPRGDFLN
jgi:hypothetical protein